MAGTGCSTQPDPIGLAGGLNLYGYAAADPINFSDPFGLCPEVTVSGSNVSIRARLRFDSNWTAADKTAVATGLSSAWSGARGGYNVTVTLEDESNASSDAPIVDVYRKPSGGNDNEGSSYGMKDGEPQGGMMAFLPGQSTSTLSGSAGHEFGHVLGITQHDGSSNNLMNATFAPGQTNVTGAQMQAVIAACGKKP